MQDRMFDAPTQMVNVDIGNFIGRKLAMSTLPVSAIAECLICKMLTLPTSWAKWCNSTQICGAMPKPQSNERPYHHGDLRRAIVKAALEILSETQSLEFSLRELARRAGVSHNAPYKHFADKRELLAAVSAAGFETLTKRMEREIAGLEQCSRAVVRDVARLHRPWC